MVIVLALALLIIDQFLKYIIRSSGGFYICNANFAFGLNFTYLSMIIIPILSAFFLIKTLGSPGFQMTIFKQNQNNFKNSIKHSIISLKTLSLYSLALIWIIIGAVSNIIDRLIFGCVIDFIDLGFWPVFNLADIYISFGAIILIIKTIKTTD